MLSQKTLLPLFLGTLIVSTTLPSARAQTTFEDAKLIPSSAIAAVFIHPKAILEDPSMDLMPRELLSAIGKRELGVDPCQIDSAMLLLDNIINDREPPGFAVTIRFLSEQKLDDKVLANAERSDLRGQPMYSFRGSNEPVVYLLDDKTIVFGMETFIKKMLSAKGATSGLINLVNQSGDEKDHVNAFLNVEPIRGFLDTNLPPKAQIPFPFQSFRSLPDEIESASVRMSFTGDQNNHLKINAVDDQSAGKVLKTIEQALGMGRGMLMSTVANELADQPGMMNALEAYDDRVGDKIEELLKPKLEGRTLTFQADANNAQLSNVAVIGTLVGMLLPAVQQVREAARRTQSMNNLRQVCLASLNYESAYMRFPSNIVDPDGKPLLSWRVAILPFIEENELYKEFHLDESWDSPHNIKLLDRMPPTFRSPNVNAETKTVYLGFQGKGTMFDPENRKVGFGQIADGSSNTILCVESNEEVAIEWSKPQDLPFNKELPGSGVGGLRPGGFIVVLADGSTHFISRTIDPETLANLIQINDGNVVNARDW